MWGYTRHSDRTVPKAIFLGEQEISQSSFRRIVWPFSSVSWYLQIYELFLQKYRFPVLDEAFVIHVGYKEYKEFSSNTLMEHKVSILHAICMLQISSQHAISPKSSQNCSIQK